MVRWVWCGGWLKPTLVFSLAQAEQKFVVVVVVWCDGGVVVVWFTLLIIEPLQVVQLCSTLFNSGLCKYEQIFV